MAVLVVYGLERVDVHHEEREIVSVPLGPLDLEFEEQLELPPVIEPRKAVVRGEPLHLIVQERLFDVEPQVVPDGGEYGKVKGLGPVAFWRDVKEGDPGDLVPGLKRYADVGVLRRGCVGVHAGMPGVAEAVFGKDDL